MSDYEVTLVNDNSMSFPLLLSNYISLAWLT